MKRKRLKTIMLATLSLLSYFPLIPNYYFGGLAGLFAEALIALLAVILIFDDLVSDWNTLSKEQFSQIGIYLIIAVIIGKVGSIMSIYLPGVGSMVRLSDADNLVACVIFVPITEEVAYRFFYFRVMKKPWFSLIVSSVLFGLGHVIIQTVELKNPVILLGALGYIVLGAVFGYSYMKTRNIWVPIVVHSTYNLIILLTNSLQLFI